MLQTILSGLKNGKTTVTGGLLGATVYADQVGFALPATRNEWFSFAISVLLAVLGLLSKDTTTGSQA